MQMNVSRFDWSRNICDDYNAGRDKGIFSFGNLIRKLLKNNVDTNLKQEGGVRINERSQK